MKKETSWGSVASWYDDLVEGDDSYQSQIILPHILRLLELRSGEFVLDLACGQGFFARTFAAAGARVVAQDIAHELVSIAKAKGGDSVEYHVGPADKIERVGTGTVDKAVCILALQNIENYREVLVEAGRVLRKGGKLFLVLNHPAFRIPKESEWGYDAEKNVQFRRLDGYLSESRSEIQMHPGKVPHETTLSFHRPLQVYFKAFTKAGFLVGRFEEWTSHKVSNSGPRATAENRARKEFPLFLCVELVRQ